MCVFLEKERGRKQTIYKAPKSFISITRQRNSFSQVSCFISKESNFLQYMLYMYFGHQNSSVILNKLIQFSALLSKKEHWKVLLHWLGGYNLVGALSHTPKVCMFDSLSGHIPELYGFDPWLDYVQEVTYRCFSHWCFFLSLSLFLKSMNISSGEDIFFKGRK